MVDDQTLDRTYAAIADPSRRSILDRLSRAELRVTEIARPLPMSLNAVSKHLKVLERAGLVRRRVEGRDHYFTIDAAALKEAADWLDHYRAFWEERLDALEGFLGRQRTENPEVPEPGARSTHDQQ
jgi:DNA-binding transcriptional ArsR family regulator